MNHDPHDPARPNLVGADAGPDAELADALRRSRILEDAPESVIQRALGVFVARPRAAAAPSPAGGLRRLAAVLGFDSATLTPQATGLRSVDAGLARPRQMLFSAEGRDVDLRIDAAPGGWQVSGQVLGPDASGRVELQCGSLRAAQDWTDLAEFRFDGVPAGACCIVLRSADWEMALPEIRIPGEDA
jgi:hypothetical protein